MISLRSGQARRPVAGYLQDRMVQELRRKTGTLPDHSYALILFIGSGHHARSVLGLQRTPGFIRTLPSRRQPESELGSLRPEQTTRRTPGGSRARPQRERQILYARWQPYVDAEPAREHVRALADAGIGWKRVAELAGVSTGSVSKLLYGGPADRPPSRRIRPQTAAAILAVRPSAQAVAPGALVDSAGTHRRVQALVTGGWSQARLAGRLRVAPSTLDAALRRSRLAREREHDAQRVAGTAAAAGRPGEYEAEAG
jgi:hypothetical protein